MLKRLTRFHASPGRLGRLTDGYLRVSTCTIASSNHNIKYRRYTTSLFRTLNFSENGKANSSSCLPLTVNVNQSTVEKDDATLRAVFDVPNFWREFSAATRQQSYSYNLKSSGRGLFGNKLLVSPQGFDDFAEITLRRCSKLVQRILSVSSVTEYIAVIQYMDRLSDLLCGLLDVAEFVRSSHPDSLFRDAATRAYSVLFEYMNQLNTSTGLNDKLKQAWNMKEVQAAWSEEEKTAAQILMREFAQSAIDLPTQERERFVKLSSEINEVGTGFASNVQLANEFIKIEPSQSKTTRSSLLGTRRLTLRAGSSESISALNSINDSDIRRRIYMANSQADADNIRRLETLLTKRAQLAQLSGYESYAHMTLVNRMAQSPEAVENFLLASLKANKHLVSQNLEKLIHLKKRMHESGRTKRDTNEFAVWDRDFYQSILVSQIRKTLGSDSPLSAYFSLGTVVRGVSRLISRLYGIRFVACETEQGEVWHPDVRRLDVLDESNQLVGIIYCDLFNRHGKLGHPAHYTIRCSRYISSSELNELVSEEGVYCSRFEDFRDAATSGMAWISADDDGVYQLPVMSLVCDFEKKGDASTVLLSFSEMKTLFHEMGHAVHSLLGRTRLHVVSGTRCAADFSELPSILMEHLATAPHALKFWAQHWDTQAFVPESLIQTRRLVDEQWTSFDTERQILLALLDQEYHSMRVAKIVNQAEYKLNSTEIYHQIQLTHSSLPEPYGVSYQGLFGHLYAYGATYYAYLLDRALAARVWRQIFSNFPNGSSNRADVEDQMRLQGEKFATHVLRWGGARDAWTCLSNLLECEYLRNGGAQAMRHVGTWGFNA